MVRRGRGLKTCDGGSERQAFQATQVTQATQVRGLRAGEIPSMEHRALTPESKGTQAVSTRVHDMQGRRIRAGQLTLRRGARRLEDTCAIGDQERRNRPS